MIEKSDKELLDALGIEVEKRINPSRSPREEYIISGFEEIRFFLKNLKGFQKILLKEMYLKEYLQ